MIKINLEKAEQMIDAAKKKSVGLDTNMCISIVDAGAAILLRHNVSR